MKWKALALAPLFVSACAGGNMLKEGKAAPALSPESGDPVRDLDGQPVDMDQLSRKGPVMLVFLRGFT